MTRSAIKIVKLICKTSKRFKNKSFEIFKMQLLFCMRFALKKTYCRYGKVANLIILYQGLGFKLSVIEIKFEDSVV